MRLTAAKPDFGSDTLGGGPVSYADLVCPPTADQPGVIFSVLHTVTFFVKNFGIAQTNVHKIPRLVSSTHLRECGLLTKFAVPRMITPFSMSYNTH
jgi:hypothetical protein